MPIFNAPQAPSRAFFRPQTPQTSIDIGGSDNSDMALMLALIGMLNRTEDREERSALDRDLFDLQKQSMEHQADLANQRAFGEAAQIVGNQIPKFLENRENAFLNMKSKLATSLRELAVEGSNAPGMKVLMNDLGRLTTMPSSEAQRFLDAFPERVEKVLNGVKEPIAQLFAAKEVDAAVRAYVGVDERGLPEREGALFSRTLWETYQDRLSSVEEMSRKALIESENILADLDSKWRDFKSSQDQGVRNIIGEERSRNFNIPGLERARRKRADIADPTRTPFKPEPYEIKMSPIRASRRDVESGRVAETVSGAPKIIAEKVEPPLAFVGRIPQFVEDSIANFFGGKQRVRGETEFEFPAGGAVREAFREVHGFAPGEFFSGPPEDSNVRIDAPSSKGFSAADLSQAGGGGETEDFFSDFFISPLQRGFSDLIGIFEDVSRISDQTPSPPWLEEASKKYQDLPFYLRPRLMEAEPEVRIDFSGG